VSTSTRGQALQTAKAFFERLLASDARGAANESSVPFMLEGKKISSADELYSEWVRNLRKRTDLLTLYGVEILTAAEMEKRYGHPPARLSAFPYKDAGALLAVANLSGHAAVAVLKRTGDRYKVVGYTD
jgi:hypothetical protein